MGNKTTTIQEVKDLIKLSLDELVGSLMTHEIRRTWKRNRKSIAFKSITEVDSDDEEALMKMMLPTSQKYKSFIKRKKQFKKYFTNQEESKGEKSKNDKIICYECKNPGHISTNCPLLKSSKKSKKKAMKTTWNDSDESASDEEIANFCFMVHNDK